MNVTAMTVRTLVTDSHMLVSMNVIVMTVYTRVTDQLVYVQPKQSYSSSFNLGAFVHRVYMAITIIFIETSMGGSVYRLYTQPQQSYSLKQT